VDVYVDKNLNSLEKSYQGIILEKSKISKILMVLGILFLILTFVSVFIFNLNQSIFIGNDIFKYLMVFIILIFDILGFLLFGTGSLLMDILKRPSTSSNYNKYLIIKGIGLYFLVFILFTSIIFVFIPDIYTENSVIVFIVIVCGILSFPLLFTGSVLQGVELKPSSYADNKMFIAMIFFPIFGIIILTWGINFSQSIGTLDLMDIYTLSYIAALCFYASFLFLYARKSALNHL